MALCSIFIFNSRLDIGIFIFSFPIRGFVQVLSYFRFPIAAWYKYFHTFVFLSLFGTVILIFSLYIRDLVQLF